MEAWKNVHLLGEPRQQPRVPPFTTFHVPVGPRNSGPQLGDANRLQIGQETLDPFFFAGTKPLQDAKHRASPALHTANPRKLSSRAASLARSTAICPSSHSASSTRPSSKVTRGE